MIYLPGMRSKNHLLIFERKLPFHILHSLGIYTQREQHWLREAQNRRRKAVKDVYAAWTILKVENQFIIETYINSLIKIENHATEFVISEMISC